jgi:hypothetical protein
MTQRARERKGRKERKDERVARRPALPADEAGA